MKRQRKPYKRRASKGSQYAKPDREFRQKKEEANQATAQAEMRPPWWERKL